MIRKLLIKLNSRIFGWDYLPRMDSLITKSRVGRDSCIKWVVSSMILRLNIDERPIASTVREKKNWQNWNFNDHFNS
jgi:hypothetical protein